MKGFTLDYSESIYSPQSRRESARKKADKHRGFVFFHLSGDPPSLKLWRDKYRQMKTSPPPLAGNDNLAKVSNV